jgi:selenide,water dikinase
LSTALKRDIIAESEIQYAVDVMSHLNAGAALAMQELGHAVHAATDITGFGLLGHMRNLLEASEQSACVFANQVPAFDGALDLAVRGSVPGGTRNNLEHANEVTRWADTISEAHRLLLCDAQTSGGMLIAVDPSSVSDLLEKLQHFKSPVAAQIGEVVNKRGELIEVVS